MSVLKHDVLVDTWQWKKYFGVCSGGYVYLYQHSSDKLFADKLYIRKSWVIQVEDLQLELVNVFN